MVKIVKAAPMGVPDIIRFHDLTAIPAQAAPPGSAVSALQSVKSTADQLDSWIHMADKGITMLGQVDSIVARAQDMFNKRVQQGGGQQQPPPTGKRPSMQPMSAPILPEMMPAAPVQQPAPVPGPAPASAAPVPGGSPIVPLPAIIQALDMIAGMQPGITVTELSEAIKRNPGQVEHIIQAYTVAAK
jgi:hypothetical protein